MMYLYIVSMFAISGIIHRLRGGYLYDLGINIPGREFLWAAPALGLFGFLFTGSWMLGVAYILSMVIWSIIPHNRWWFAGASPRGSATTKREPMAFELFCEKIVDKLTFGNTNVSDFLLFSLKHYVAAIPFFYVLGWPAVLTFIPVSLTVAAIYHLVQKYNPVNHWLVEILGGAVMWGMPVLLFLI